MVKEPNDWRLTNQEKYFKNAVLSWKKYTKYREGWEHDHCEFCRAKFMEQPGPEILTEGFATSDNYRWVCKTCFEDFKNLFQWQIT
jgi:phage terminase large subunit-like protein